MAAFFNICCLTFWARKHSVLSSNKYEVDYLCKKTGYRFGHSKKRITFALQSPKGGLAQLARALAWHARGHRFDSDILHQSPIRNGRALLFSIHRK